MNTTIYLNYAVYNNGKNDYLVKVHGGYVASDSWMKSDEAYSQIAGRTFCGLFGDNGKVATCDKGKIRRLTSDEEYNTLHNSACKRYKQMEKAYDVMWKLHESHSFDSRGDRIRAYEEILSFGMYGHAMFDHSSLIDADPENPEHDELFEQLAKMVMKLN
jgi:hypothetical protein